MKIFTENVKVNTLKCKGHFQCNCHQIDLVDRSCGWQNADYPYENLHNVEAVINHLSCCEILVQPSQGEDHSQMGK